MYIIATIARERAARTHVIAAAVTTVLRMHARRCARHCCSSPGRDRCDDSPAADVRPERAFTVGRIWPYELGGYRCDTGGTRNETALV